MVINILIILIGYLIRLSVIKSQRNNIVMSIGAPVSLKTDGWYKYIRHPMYLGSLIMYIGLGLILTNIGVTIVTSYLMFNFLFARMLQEEQLLLNIYGDFYLNYMKQTKRLIPFIF